MPPKTKKAQPQRKARTTQPRGRKKTVAKKAVATKTSKRIERLSERKLGEERPVTGRGTRPAIDESDGVPTMLSDWTMEIRTRDIIAQDDVSGPSHTARRPPPPPVTKRDD